MREGGEPAAQSNMASRSTSEGASNRGRQRQRLAAAERCASAKRTRRPSLGSYDRPHDPAPSSQRVWTSPPTPRSPARSPEVDQCVVALPCGGRISTLATYAQAEATQEPCWPMQTPILDAANQRSLHRFSRNASYAARLLCLPLKHLESRPVRTCHCTSIPLYSARMSPPHCVA